jgi:2-C-methyl-D-erythritol 4-phosphate cytidylyltransferase
VTEPVWFVIPAAGAASRFGGPVPKQWLRIGGHTVLEHALRAVRTCPGLAGGVVVLARGDRRFVRLTPAQRRGVLTTTGGRERAHSVLNGLRALDSAANEDWVLVHDAARPCLPRRDLRALVAACAGDAVGGLLALPVADALKQADRGGRSRATLPRGGVWRALTPQLFRYGLLRRALTAAVAAGRNPADEAEAVEALGFRPRLVAGSALNIKITRAADLPFAKAALAARGRQR